MRIPGMERVKDMLVLWDIDGTLLHGSQALHLEAFSEAFDITWGKSVEFESTDDGWLFDGQKIAGMVDAQIYRLACRVAGIEAESGEAKLPQFVKSLGERYEYLVRNGGKVGDVLPGARIVLRSLQSVNTPLGVLTGNCERVAYAKLKNTGLAEMLPVGAYGDAAQTRSELFSVAMKEAEGYWGIPHNPRHTVYVGDSPRDVFHAKKNGVRSVAVATGDFTMDQLIASGADLVLPHLLDDKGAQKLIFALAVTE